MLGVTVRGAGLSARAFSGVTVAAGCIPGKEETSTLGGTGATGREAEASIARRSAVSCGLENSVEIVVASVIPPAAKSVVFVTDKDPASVDMAGKMVQIIRLIT